MKKINVFSLLSLDGYCAGPNGEMDDFPHDEESSRFSDEQSGRSNVLMFGHTTYKMMECFWPTPAAEKMATVTAKNMRNNRKIVFSRTLKSVKEGPEWKNIEVLNKIVPEEILKLKEQSESGITILGSPSIVQQLTNLGLIDEYQLMVHPVVFGKGLELFKGVKRTDLKLKNTRTFKNGNVLFVYEIIRRDAE